MGVVIVPIVCASIIQSVRWLFIRLSPILHLTRVSTAFAAVANSWFVILWTRKAGPEFEPGVSGPLWTHPVWALLIAGAVNALGLFAFGAALNDLLDVRRDRQLHPDRPLASGRMSAESAIALITGTLLVAMLGAAVLGVQPVVLTIVVAAAIVFFNAAGKFVPGVGLVALGLIYAGQAVIPNISLRFVWPVWLVMTHSLGVAAAAYVLGRKVPPISRRAGAAAIAGWLFWSAVIFAFGIYRNSGHGGLWPHFVELSAGAVTLVLVALYILTAYRKVSLLGPGPRAAEKVARYGSLWIALYATGWMLGQGYTGEAAVLGLLALAGFLGMTVLREVYAFVEHPLGYKR